MKINAVLALLPLAFAAPSHLHKRDLPNHTPVSVKGLDTDFTIKCGQVNVDPHDVHKAVSWGVNLERAEQTVGSGKYPHYYGNNGNKRFDFLDPLCTTNPNRKEFPVIKGGYFNGDGDDDPAYKFRAIYVFNPDAPQPGNDPQAQYCGTIYHAGKDFEGCDIRKKQ